MDEDEKEDDADHCIKYSCNSGEVCVLPINQQFSFFGFLQCWSRAVFALDVYNYLCVQ